MFVLAELNDLANQVLPMFRRTRCASYTRWNQLIQAITFWSLITLVPKSFSQKFQYLTGKGSYRVTCVFDE